MPDLLDMQHLLCLVVEGIQSGTIESDRPELPPRIVALLEHERRSAQRHHLVKAGAATVGFGEREADVGAGKARQILEQILGILGLAKIGGGADMRALLDHRDLEPGGGQSQGRSGGAEPAAYDQNVGFYAFHLQASSVCYVLAPIRRSFRRR